MKKTICIVLAAAVLIPAFSLPGYAWHGVHYRGGVWIGPTWRPVWRPVVYPYPYYVGPPAVIRQPVIIAQRPTEYVQQAPESEEESYWYYCQDPKGYYPYVKKCPEGWMKVVPSPAPPDEED